MTKKTKIIIGSASFATVLLIIVIGLIVGYSVQRNTLNLIYTKDTLSVHTTLSATKTRIS